MPTNNRSFGPTVLPIPAVLSCDGLQWIGSRRMAGATDSTGVGQNIPSPVVLSWRGGPINLKGLVVITWLRSPVASWTNSLCSMSTASSAKSDPTAKSDIPTPDRLNIDQAKQPRHHCDTKRLKRAPVYQGRGTHHFIVQAIQANFQGSPILPGLRSESSLYPAHAPDEQRTEYPMPQRKAEVRVALEPGLEPVDQPEAYLD